MEYTVFSYRGTRNLGDAIQTYALARLLSGALQSVDRDGQKFPSKRLLVINGWIGSPLTLDGAEAICAGIHVRFKSCRNVEWLKPSIGNIGSRDPYTQQKLLNRKIASEMIGCATMTLPRYEGLRSGKIRVDGPPVEGCLNFSNKIRKSMSWERQWASAKVRLEQLKRAEIVFTNRLHIALPCLAFGTPVFITECRRGDPRFSLWDWLGLAYGTTVVADLSSHRHRYLSWLEERLATKLWESEPQMPVEAKLILQPNKKIVVGILSAERYDDRRERCRATWAKFDEQIEFLFLVGDSALGVPMLEGDILKLPCPDDYQSLPQKVRLFCQWALEHRQFEYLLKCDDDTYLVTDRLLQHDWQDDYIGRSRNGRFAYGGPGYLLSPKAARIVAEKLTMPTGHEDVDVGHVLRKQGIKLTECRLFGPRPRTGRIPAPDNALISVHPVRDDLMQHISASLANERQLPMCKVESERQAHGWGIETAHSHLEIVSHCWRYSRLLSYQLSSLVLFPPAHTITMTVYYCEEDTETKNVLDFFSTHRLTSVRWNWRPLPRTHLFRRSIGRNEAALNTRADWIWFADCDYYFTSGFLDRLCDELKHSRETLVFPHEVRRITEAMTETLIAQIQRQPVGIFELPVGESTAQRFTRAIGGIQIVRGDVARRKGYCRDIPKLQRPLKKWKRTVDDVYFRKMLGTSGKPIDVPGLVRIGHANKGREDPTVQY